MNKKIVVSLLVLFVALNSLVYVAAKKSQHDELIAQFEVALNGIAQLINNNLENNRRALSRMAHRWDIQGGTPERLWRSDAYHYAEDLAGAYGTGFADADTVIQWIEPVERNKGALKFRLNSEERRRKAIEKANLTRSAQMTDPVTLAQGGSGFLMLNPVYRNEKLNGYVYLASRFDHYFLTVLVSDQYCLRFKYNSENLYETCNKTQFNEVANYKINHKGLIAQAPEWSIEFAPKPDHLHAITGYFVLKVMLISVAITGFFLLLIYAFFDIRNKSKTIQEQFSALQLAKIKAEEGSQAKEDFLTTMSHEIRTPLNGIIGLANLLKDTPLNEAQQDYVHHLNESGTLLLALINDVLDITKIESGKFDLEIVNFNLEQAVDHIVSSFSYVAKSKNVSLIAELEEPCPHWVRGDVARFKQILINLIGNAIKFTHRGQVIVRSKVLRATKETLLIRIHVIDQGVGISHKSIAKLFSKFVQASRDVHSQFGGTGLGLAICKKIVEKMGGSIDVVSEEGKGSDFFFTLEFPVGVEEFLSTDPDSLPVPQLKKNLKILLAEDNLVNQKVAVAILQKYGYECQTVANGLEALKLMQQVHFDLILMDCLMPEMDGYEATREIRKLSDPVKSKIPIIALTANALPEDRRRCLDAGMDGYITKPVSVNNLLEALRSKLSR